MQATSTYCDLLQAHLRERADTRLRRPFDASGLLVLRPEVAVLRRQGAPAAIPAGRSRFARRVGAADTRTAVGQPERSGPLVNAPRLGRA
jgi:hypothetical protein